MEPGYCIDCGATIRVKAKTPGTCPYCGVHIETGRDTFRAIEALDEPPPIREERRRDSRFIGAVQVAVGTVLIVVFASMGWFISTFWAALLAAHGLYRVLFSSGPNRSDEDYDAKD